MASDEDEKVGFGKPPRHSRFKAGQSGNPKGRPKGTKNYATEVRETLEMPVFITEGGKQKAVSTRKAALLKLRHKALKDDQKALDALLKLAQAHGEAEGTVRGGAPLRADDEAIIARYMARRAKGEAADE